ncbi:MAG: HEAT repeat domain-containing protein [Myxococcota bacterium]
MTPERLKECLASDRVEERREAVRYLQGTAILSEDERSALFALLGDEDWRIRRDALDVAVAVADESFVDAVIEGILQNDRVGLRNACIELGRTLGALYAAAIADRLAAGHDASPLLFDAIAREGDVDFLARHAEGDDVNIAAAAIAALARVGGPSAEERLAMLLDSGERFRVLAALDGLRELSASLDFERLQPFLEDRIVWRSVLPLLGDTKDARAAAALARGLASPGSVAREAALGLAALDHALNDQTVPETLGESERRRLRELAGRDEVGTAALALLVRARDAEVVEPLLEAVAEHRLPPVAVASLRDWGADAARLVVDAAVHRPIALQLAAELASAGDLDPVVGGALIEAIEDADEEVVVAALRGLALVGEQSVITPVTRLALNDAPAVARHAALCLSSLAHRHREAVAESLRAVRLDAGGAELATVLGDVLGEEAKPTLVAALSVDDATLRAACASALGELGGEDAVRHLSFALGDDSALVRLAAADALGSLRLPSAHAALTARSLVEGDDDVLEALRKALRSGS